jgi:hypothetical protein
MPRYARFKSKYWSHRKIGVLVRCQHYFESAEPPKRFQKAKKRRVKKSIKKDAREEFKKNLRDILFGNYQKAKTPSRLFDTIAEETGLPLEYSEEMRNKTRTMCREQRLKNALDSLDEMSEKSDFCQNDSTLSWLEQRFFKKKEGQENIDILAERYNKKRMEMCKQKKLANSKVSKLRKKEKLLAQQMMSGTDNLETVQTSISRVREELIDAEIITELQMDSCTPVPIDEDVKRNIEHQIRLHAISVDICCAIKRLDYCDTVRQAILAEEKEPFKMKEYLACEKRITEMQSSRDSFRKESLEILSKNNANEIRPLLEVRRDNMVEEQRQLLLEKHATLESMSEEIYCEMCSKITTEADVSDFIRFEIAQMELQKCIYESQIAVNVCNSDTVAEYIRAHTELDPWSLNQTHINTIDGEVDAVLDSISIGARAEWSSEDIETLRALLNSKDQMKRLRDMAQRPKAALEKEYDDVIWKRAEAAFRLGNAVSRRDRADQRRLERDRADKRKLNDNNDMADIVSIVLQPFLSAASALYSLFPEDSGPTDQEFDQAMELAKDGAIDEMRFAIAGKYGVMLSKEDRQYDMFTRIFRSTRLRNPIGKELQENVLSNLKKRTPWNKSTRWSSEWAQRLKLIFLGLQVGGSIAEMGLRYIHLQEEKAEHYAALQYKKQFLRRRLFQQQKAFERDVIRRTQEKNSDAMAKGVRQRERNRKAFERDVVRPVQEKNSDAMAKGVRRRKAFERDVVRAVQEKNSDAMAKGVRQRQRNRMAFERDVVRPVQEATSNELAERANMRQEMDTKIQMGFKKDVIEAVETEKQKVYIPIVACADLTWFGIPYDHQSLVNGKQDSNFLAHGGQCAFSSPPNEGDGYVSTVLRNLMTGRQMTDVFSNMVSFTNPNKKYGYDYFFKVFIQPQAEASGMTYSEWISKNQFEKKPFMDRAMDYMPQVDRFTARETPDGVELYLNGRHMGYYHGDYDPMSSQPFGKSGFQSKYIEGLEGWRLGPRILGGGIVKSQSN